MNTLPIGLLLLVEDGVLVLGEHLLLTGHLRVPPLNGLGALPLSGKSSTEGINNLVHGAQTLALPGLLGRRETPWDLPVSRKGKLLALYSHDQLSSTSVNDSLTREDPRAGATWA